jgi:hypothetical protein
LYLNKGEKNLVNKQKTYYFKHNLINSLWFSYGTYLLVLMNSTVNPDQAIYIAHNDMQHQISVLLLLLLKLEKHYSLHLPYVTPFMAGLQ